jgi:hypothetical protein
VVLGTAPAAFAQKNELAFIAGGQLSFYPQDDVGAGFVFEGSYARRLFHVPTLSMFLEVPVTSAPNLESPLPTGHYSSLFIAPGLKLKFVPEFFISPFFTVGYGWAHFRQKPNGIVPERTADTDVVQFGAGVDIKLAPFIGLRFQARDYFSGELGFNNATLDRQQNLTTMGGVVFRF